MQFIEKSSIITMESRKDTILDIILVKNTAL